MLKRTGPNHRIRIDGDQFVVHDQTGQRLFEGSYQEVELWLDQRENVVQPAAVRPRRSLVSSVLKMMGRNL